MSQTPSAPYAATFLVGPEYQGRMVPMSNVVTLATKPTLLGDLVLLRPVSVADVDSAAEMVTDPETVRLTGSHAAFNRDRLEWWYATRGERDDRLDLAVVERATGRYVGEVVLTQLDRDNRSCSFRIALIGAHAVGRGMGTEATRLVLAYAFETIGLHRVDLEVFAFNPRARHVYEKVGFVYEGTKRHALRWDEAWIDAGIMAILADDWAAHRGWPGLDEPRRSEKPVAG
ncbi:GNAT family N-acetyltransferase [Actinopolymorpha alba]|uniref:GNAT family N-acetyltransferase n=1 Tax=Actinopolymorpha alba TaxID=533267 RepID=UPI001ED9C4A5|nr:GNAT family protein [Actinopolymorpha alba]